MRDTCLKIGALAIALLVATPLPARLTDAPASMSAPGGCGQIKADCKTHKISIRGQSKTINCGRNGTTITGTGKVGGRHSGPVVPNGVEIETPRMGRQGGGKVFHTPNPRAMSGTPRGVDNTKGCIAVDLATLNTLKSCRGSPLEIIGNNNGAGATQQLASRQSWGRSPSVKSIGRGGTK